MKGTLHDFVGYLKHNSSVDELMQLYDGLVAGRVYSLEEFSSILCLLAQSVWLDNKDITEKFVLTHLLKRIYSRGAEELNKFEGNIYSDIEYIIKSKDEKKLSMIQCIR